MSTPPWTKEYKDLTRYDWLTACSVHDSHSEKPRDLRVANCLMQHMHGETRLAFPSQHTIAQWARVSHPRKVRDSLDALQASGAIKRKRMDELQPETLELIKELGRKTMRAVVYKLDMFWAFETFEKYKFRLSHPISEPERLRVARRQQGTMLVPYEGTVLVPYIGDYAGPANTIGNTVDTLGSALNKELTQDSLLGKEVPIEPAVLIPPEDPEQARRWLFHIVSDKSRLTWALGLMAENKLTPEIIRELAA
ncbi:hypothetical protein OE766_03750 [Pararhizobium sp. YC-54]|uniref:hypothetical protein n=1 Tax=Pararhizobium sp. YC-54 TaxID=2986920 RepID=UPI0021F6A712|nr:hypothetical protein [Pararhizobium sp. YC-54]MCV9997352.1 hypothetical protein [Pararhizobium sp. YC-54]